MQSRSIFIQTTGWALILICLSMPVLTLYMAFDPLPTPHWIVAAPIAICACYVAVRQFRSLYCCPPIASRPCSGILSTVGVLLIVGGVTLHFEGLSYNQMIGSIIVGTIMIILDIGAALLAKRNRRKAVSDDILIECSFDRFYPFFQDYRNREIVGFGLMTLLVLSTAWFCIFNYHILAYGKHLPFEKMPFEGLPKAGSDFSFKRDHRNWLRCEFTITEQDFKEWVSTEKHWTGIEKVEHYLIPPRARLSDDRNDIAGFRALPEIEGGPNAIFDKKTDRANYWKYSVETSKKMIKHQE